MRFMKNYGRVAHYAPAYAMNDEFSRVLHQQMEFFSSNPSADTLNRVRGEVSEASVLWPVNIFFHFIMFAPISFSILLRECTILIVIGFLREGLNALACKNCF